jgi:hypothetical protein
MKGNILKLIGIVNFVLTTTAPAWSQSLEIDFVELTGRNIVVHYNLDDGANSTRQFLVQLYSSQDNFTTALTKVSGNIGSEVSAGVDRKIVWDITKELGAFKGDIALELRGRVYVPFVKIRDIAEGQIFKHGKNYPLNWSSGNLSGQINIELFNSSDERIWGENNVPNVGKFDWYIPGNVKKGKNYRLKFTNGKDRNDVVYSPSFIIKPKIPLIAKIVGLAVIAVGAEVILSQKSKTSEAAPYSGPLAPPNN